MATRAQIIRLASRIEAIAGGKKDRLVVVDPCETEQEALQRLGLAGAGSYIFIRTGVPRLTEGCA